VIFYDWHGAPSPRRARMFIAEKGIEIERQHVDMKAREQFSPEFLTINPRATVPALVTDTGFALTENVGIAAYLEEKFPKPLLMGQTAEEKGAVLMWNAICETQGPVSFEQIPELAKRSRKRADIFFNTLEAQLSTTQYLTGDEFTFADITGFVVCDFARLVKIPILESCSATQAWYDKINERPSAKV